MSILDVLAIWVASVDRFVIRTGGSLRFSRSPGDRLNDSAHVVITCGDQEVDLILWESGEAEYARISHGVVEEQHFDDVAEPGLGAVLARMIEILDR